MSKPSELLRLPADRELPAEVRRRIRARVIAPSRSTVSGSKFVAGLSVATVTAVVVLAALVSRGMAAGPVRADVGTGGWTRAEVARIAAGNHFWTPQEVYAARTGWAPPAALRRCSRPAVEGDRAAAAAWRPLLTVSAHGVTVVGLAAGQERFFCELTAATVSVSAPVTVSATGASSARVAVFTHLGTVAGLVANGVGSVEVSAAGVPTSADAAVVSSGIFIRPNAFAAGTGSVRVSTPGASANTPGTMMVDDAGRRAGKPVTDTFQPAGDRTSAAGQRLGRCLDDSVGSDGSDGPPVPDPADWQPGAVAALDGSTQLQVGRYDGLLAVCRIGRSGPGSLSIVQGRPGETDEPELVADASVAVSETVFYHFVDQADGSTSSDTVAIAGFAVPPRATTVSLSRPASATITVPVVNGTFVLPGVRLNEAGKGPDVSVLTIRDSAGRPLHAITLRHL